MTNATPARGRPRDEELSERILEEVRLQLRDGGFRALRVGDIAKAVGCGVSTIYRRWPTRERLIAEAMASRPAIEFDPSDNPADDLRAAIVAAVASLGVTGNVLSAAMELAQTDDGVAEAIRSVLEPLTGMFRTIIATMIGAEHHSLETIVDAIPSLLIYRTAIFGATFDGNELADEILTLIDAVRS